jgi:hypothetical protein
MVACVSFIARAGSCNTDVQLPVDAWHQTQANDCLVHVLNGVLALEQKK